MTKYALRAALDFCGVFCYTCRSMKKEGNAMKKILSALLCLVMLLGLAACGGTPAETKTGEAEAFDFDALSAEELEAHAASLRTKLAFYQFETTEHFENGSVGDVIIRETFLRSGYNAYDRSVTMGSTQTAFFYENKTALFRDASNRIFRAENVSADDFDAACALFSPYAAFQDWTGFPCLKKEGKTVTFESDGDGVDIPGTLPGAIAIKTVTGTRTFDDEGFFSEETLVVTGDYGGWKDVTVTFTSVAVDLPAGERKLETIDTEKSKVIEVSDLRAGELYHLALNALCFDQKELALTLSEGTVNGAEETHTDSAFAMKNGNFFLEERQAVKEDGEWAYATHFVECRGEVRREATYEQVLAPDPGAEEPPKNTDPKKGEEPEDPIVETAVTEQEKNSEFMALVFGRIAPLDFLRAITLTENPGMIDLTIEFDPDRDITWIPTGASVEGVKLKKGEGVAQIANGILTFIRYTIEWSDGGSYSFSLSLDKTENVTLGTIEAPEPVDPNTAYGDHHND